MGNVIAIAQKELKSYFSSPIAYIAIGFFAFLYGYFYVAILQYFVRQSMQMNQFGGGPQALNINQVLIRQLLQNVTILILFIMPMVTMRTYSEEKRSGTIELLLTSSLTDFQIILGKFFGALALWATQLTFNGAWSPLFFGAKKPTLALGDIGLMLAAIATYTAAARKVDKPAAWLMSPYLAWVAFATVLNAEIVRLNE